jgi:hypothetical protein
MSNSINARSQRSYRNATKVSQCLSVCLSACNNSTTAEQIFMQFDIGEFR